MFPESVHRTSARAARIAARAAPSGRLSGWFGGSAVADRENREQLLDIIAFAAGARDRRLPGNKQLEAAVALAAAVFKKRHVSENSIPLTG